MKRVEDTVEQATKKINAIGCAQGQKPVAKNLSCKAISGIAGIGASGVCEADIYCSATELPCGSQASSF
ncbi:MAG: hypothetical protein GC204_03660 [Chloroflexi bacterium]|nr:hypothetical protein [Chloroflexota bacterium]